jgi:hypothetical protein
MTTARAIIQDCLTWRLNRLSIGETMDADTADRCLSALNSVIDEINGGMMLWREILVTGTVTGATASLSTVWAPIKYGDPILGATYRTSNTDLPIEAITLQQYHERVAVKTITGLPASFAYDGADTLYFYPVPAGVSVTLRSQEARPDFADLDTAYSTPDGWQSGLSALLAETVAPWILGGIPPAVSKAANVARRRLMAQTLVPAIIDGGTGQGRRPITGLYV